MRLYLQFGYGMMGLCRDLLRANVGAGVILSPRDLNINQLRDVAQDVREANAEVYFDPQCYVRDADHERLTQHGYWNAFKATSTSSVLAGGGVADVVNALQAYNQLLETKALILPGTLAAPVTQDWLYYHRKISEEAARIVKDREVFSTIGLSPQAIADEAQIEAIIDAARSWTVGGFYVVAQAPQYLAEDANWLANLMILTSGLKLLGRQVLVGYGNHQLLCLAAANVDAVAAGTWLNVRFFNPDKFRQQEDSVSRRTIWYYCPQSLSEYKITFLDAARRTGVLDDLRADPSLGSTYADPLFAGALPTSVSWGDSAAFRHYLTCLNSQVLDARKSSFDQTISAYEDQLNTAEALISKLAQNGVFGSDRDFSDIVDINRSAMVIFNQARGPQMRRNW